MRRTKNIFKLLLLLSAGAAQAQYTDQINTNRPGQSMSGFSVGESIFQIETGIYGIKEKHDVLNYDVKGLGVDLTVRYGAILEELEFIASVQYQFDRYEDALYNYGRNDVRSLTLGAKYLIYDPDKNYTPEINIYSWHANHKFKWRSLIPAVAVYGGVNLMGKDNPYSFPNDGISPKLIAIAHNHFGKWVWVNNIIADKIGSDYPSYGLITTLTRGFNEKWSGFLEFQGYSSDYYADGIFRVGAAHLLTDTMQIDASISSNFKETPSIMYASVGFAWRFDANYRDILLPGKGDKEDEYNAEQKKKESDRNKKKKEREERRKKFEEPLPEPQTE